VKKNFKRNSNSFEKYLKKKNNKISTNPETLFKITIEKLKTLKVIYCLE
jgi:hypothetical protein